MRCGQCGIENKADAKFCADCGFALTIACPKCQHTMSSQQAFCSECGYAVFQKCRQCNQINRENNRFCSGCGTTLKTICLSCGADNPPGSRFCGSCSFILMETDPSVCRYCSFVNMPGQLFCGNCKRQLLSDQEHHEQISRAGMPGACPHEEPPPSQAKISLEALEKRQEELRRSLLKERVGTSGRGMASSELLDIVESSETIPVSSENIVSPATPDTPPPVKPTMGSTAPPPLNQTVGWTEVPTGELLAEKSSRLQSSGGPLAKPHDEDWGEEIAWLPEAATSLEALSPSAMERPAPVEEDDWTAIAADPEALQSFYQTATGPVDEQEWLPKALLEEDEVFPPPEGFGRMVGREDDVSVVPEHRGEVPSPSQVSHEAWEDSPKVRTGTVGLETFALASIELVPALLGPQNDDPMALQAFISRTTATIEQWVTSRGGAIESVHPQTLFVAFSSNSSAEDSVLQALELMAGLSSQQYDFQGCTFGLKIGMDMESAVNRNPIASTTERNVAKPGAVVVSEAVYQLAEDRYEFEAIGPLRVGNRLISFYELLQLKYTQPTAPMASEEPLAAPHTGAAEPSYSDSFGADAQVAQARIQQGLSGGEALSWQELLYQAPTLEYWRQDVPRTQGVSYHQGYEWLFNTLSEFITAGVEGKARVLSVSATEGLGKTYILDAINAQVSQQPQLAQNVFWLTARAYQAHGQHQIPLSLWFDWLQGALGLWGEANRIDRLQEVITSNLGFLYDQNVPPDVRALFDVLWGATPIEAISLDTREKMGWFESTLLQFIQYLASKKPLVFVLDDVHQADSASLRVLEALLASELLNKSICFILTHPKNVYPANELATLVGQIPYQEVVINELTPDEAKVFLKDGPLFGSYDLIPPVILDQLVNKSSGLPHYLLEGLRLLHHQGVLTYEMAPNGQGGRLVVNPAYSGSLQGVLLPPQMREVVAHRYGFLSENARNVVLLACVLGEKFPMELLQDCCAGMSEQLYQDTVRELYDQGWVVPDGATCGRFTHRLNWEILYFQVLSGEQRVHYHSLVSEYLQELAQPDKNFAVNPAALAYHSHQAQLVNRAFHYWNLTGVKSAQLGDLMGTNICLSKALSLLPMVQDPQSMQWALQIRDNLAILNLDENPGDSVQLLEGTARYYYQTNNMAKVVETLGVLANCHENLGQFYEAMEAGEMALSVVPKAQFPLEYTILLTNQMEYLYHLGKLQKAQALFHQEITPLTQQYSFDHDPIYVNCLLTSDMVRAKCMALQCQSGAVAVLDEAIAKCQAHQLEDRAIEGALAKAYVHLLCGEYVACQENLQGLLDRIEKQPHQEKHLAQWSFVALKYYCEHGDWQNAYKLVQNTIAQAENGKDYIAYLQGLAMKGRVAWALGDPVEGRRLIEQAIGLSSQYRFGTCALMGWRFLAELEMSQGNYDTALTLATQALGVAEMADMQVVYDQILLGNIRANCLVSKGELKEAGQILEALWPMANNTGYANLIAETSLQVGLLYQRLASSVATEEVIQQHHAKAQECLTRAHSMWQQLGNAYQVRRVEIHLK